VRGDGAAAHGGWRYGDKDFLPPTSHRGDEETVGSDKPSPLHQIMEGSLRIGNDSLCVSARSVSARAASCA